MSRTDELCGTGHPCKPLAEYIHVTNNGTVADKINDEGSVDIKYSGMLGVLAYEIYTQFMSVDGPNSMVHSGKSHLDGASIWLSLRTGVEGNTVEYASSIATSDIFGGITQYGFAYHGAKYPDCTRYRAAL